MGTNKHRRLPVNLRKHFCSVRVTNQGHRMLRGAAESLFLEISKSHLDRSNWLWVPCFRRGLVKMTSRSPFQPQPFCDTVINANKKCQYKALIQTIGILLIGILTFLSVQLLFVCPNWDFCLAQILDYSCNLGRYNTLCLQYSKDIALSSLIQEILMNCYL